MPTAADYRAAFGDPQTLAKAAGGTNALKTAASAMSLQNAMATRKRNQRALQKDMFKVAFNVASAAKNSVEWDTIFTNLANSPGYEEASQYVGRWKDKDDILAVAAARIFDPTSDKRLVRGEDGSFSIGKPLSATQTKTNQEIAHARKLALEWMERNPATDPTDLEFAFGEDSALKWMMTTARKRMTGDDPGFKPFVHKYRTYGHSVGSPANPVPADELSTQEDFDAMPSGTFYVNPSNGAVYQKD